MKGTRRNPFYRRAAWLAVAAILMATGCPKTDSRKTPPRERTTAVDPVSSRSADAPREDPESGAASDSVAETATEAPPPPAASVAIAREIQSARPAGKLVETPDEIALLRADSSIPLLEIPRDYLWTECDEDPASQPHTHAPDDQRFLRHRAPVLLVFESEKRRVGLRFDASRTVLWWLPEKSPDRVRCAFPTDVSREFELSALTERQVQARISDARKIADLELEGDRPLAAEETTGDWLEGLPGAETLRLSATQASISSDGATMYEVTWGSGRADTVRNRISIWRRGDETYLLTQFEVRDEAESDAEEETTVEVTELRRLVDGTWKSVVAARHENRGAYAGPWTSSSSFRAQNRAHRFELERQSKTYHDSVKVRCESRPFLRDLCEARGCKEVRESLHSTFEITLAGATDQAEKAVNWEGFTTEGCTCTLADDCTRD